MSQRLLSGHEPLDTVLGGGLPANAISLIMGRPGSGKTILAQQYVFRNATPERPVSYFSTVSEPLEKIVRFGQSLNFFDRTAIGTSVFYEDLGGTVTQHGLTGVTEQISAAIKERRPGLIVIDSFKALHAFVNDFAQFRRFLHELAGRLSAFPTASLWVGEYEDAEIGSSAEFAVADGHHRADHGQVRLAGGTDPGGQEAQGQRFLVRGARVPDHLRRAAAVSAARRRASRSGLPAERRAGVIGEAAAAAQPAEPPATS